MSNAYPELETFLTLCETHCAEIRKQLDEAVGAVMATLEELDLKSEMNLEDPSESIQSAVGLSSAITNRLESLGKLDSKIQDAVMTLMGSLSIDDVIGQRMLHILNGLDSVSGSVGPFLKSDKAATDAVFAAIYKDYTMEEEKQVHKSIVNVK